MIQSVMLGAVIVLSIANLGFIFFMMRRLKVIEEAQSERSVENQLGSLQEQISRSDREIRDEVRNTQAAADARFQNLQQSIETRLDKMRETTDTRLKDTVDTLVNTVGELGKTQDTRLENVRKTVHDRLEAMQSSSENELKSTVDTLVNTIGELGKTQDTRLENIRKTVHDRLEAMQSSSENELKSTVDTLVNTIGELGKTQDTRLENVRKTVHDRLEAMQSSSENELKSTVDTLVNTIGEFGKSQDTRLQTNADTLVNTIGELGKSQDTQLENVKKTVHDRLEAMQASNEKKLDQMRNTVDEKLQSTLEKRFGESFNQVSKRLEEVQRGLGEMQELATGVGDLKRVLANVKTRGTWGEVQLGALLEEILTSEQYSANVQLNDDSYEEVEYAIRLPGSDDAPDSCVWLPIDCKFPLADYEKLAQASEAADKDEIEKATRAFLTTVRNAAKTISEKYIAPPKTTDFAIMFLPTEGLYAEVLRSPDDVADLRNNYRIIVAGPTTLTAILNSLRVGFRTLAIEKRSSEVWEILAAVKKEFGKFGNVMDKLGKQLNTASNTVEKTKTRTRAMERTLRTVEELPADEATAHLELTDEVSAS